MSCFVQTTEATAPSRQHLSIYPSRLGNLFAGSTPASDEHVMIGELPEQLRRLAEIGGQDVGGGSPKPLRQVDGLIDSGIESDQNASCLVSHIFDRVPVALRDVPDVPLLQLLDPVAPVRAEQGDAHLALYDVLPLVGGWMPVQR